MRVDRSPVPAGRRSARARRGSPAPQRGFLGGLHLPHPRPRRRALTVVAVGAAMIAAGLTASTAWVTKRRSLAPASRAPLAAAPVPLISAAPATAAEPAPVTPEPEPVTPEPVTPEPEPEPTRVLQHDDLPLRDYDHLTLGSLRSRLRALDPGDLQQILAYERAHANRLQIVKMFENRLVKLAALEQAAALQEPLEPQGPSDAQDSPA